MYNKFWILVLSTILIGNFITTSYGDQRDCLFTTDQPNDCESNRDCVNLHSKGPLNQYQHCVWYNYPDNQKSKNVCCSKNYAGKAYVQVMSQRLVTLSMKCYDYLPM